MLDLLEEAELTKGSKNAGARVSMQNVAAYAGVSIATVSKVMQGVSTVLPENVTKVQNAIEALGYRINPLGAELRRGRRNLIGAILPNLEDGPTARFVAELELKVEAKGHVLFVASSHRSEAREAELAGRMLDWRVGGVVVVPVKDQRSGAGVLLDDAGVPAVFLQRSKGTRKFDTVSPDGHQLALNVATKLGRSKGGRILVLESSANAVSVFSPTGLGKDIARNTNASQVITLLVEQEDFGKALEGEAHASPPPRGVILSFGTCSLDNAWRIRNYLASLPAGTAIVQVGEALGDINGLTIGRLPVPIAQLATRAVSLLFQRIECPDGPALMESVPFTG